MRRLLPFLAIAALSHSCVPTERPFCTSDTVLQGARIQVRDALTGKLVCNVTVTERASTLVESGPIYDCPESLFEFGSGNCSEVVTDYGVPVTLDLVVDHPDYQTLVLPGVVIQHHDCRPLTRYLCVDLERR